MKKKRKVFKTKKNIRWNIIDVIVVLLIFIINIRDILLNFDEFVEQYSGYNNLSSWILIIIMVIIFRIFISIPYLIIYFSMRYAIKKHNKSVVTFDVEHDLEYYREKFNGISPASMSLLMDLNLETYKDLGAMKLYYELNDIYMYVNDRTIAINNPNNIKLTKSDEILLKYFFDGKDKLFSLNEWKENVICENINNNLIIRKTSKDKKKGGCGIFLLLHILSFVYIICFVLNIRNDMDILNTFNTNIQTEEELITAIMNNPDFMFFIILLFIFAAALILYGWSIVGGFIHFIMGNMVSVKDKFKRTKEGNILTEKLFGMKNFIHDFSNLDEASKKQLVLWDEFLIYAVVLEENDIILKEISNLYHTDLQKYKNYKY